MRKDPTEFRERFAKWKAGELVYEAGKISDQQYYDTMERVAELNNAEWNKERRSEGSPELSVDEEFVRILNDNAYDYRGYYNKYPNGKGNAIDHWTDEFKTVYHPTFSIYSKYSGKKSLYNPEGILGGRWDGEKYIPALRQKLPKYGGGKSEYDNTINFIKQYEGFKDTTYLDGNGIPTIGYGFTNSSLVKKGRITRAEADKLLIKEIKQREAALSKLKNWNNLSDDAKTALRSYYYNYPDGFKDNTKFIKYWNAEDFDNAIREVDAGMNDKKNPGLRTRRLLEQLLLRQDPFLKAPKRRRNGAIEQMMESVPQFVPPIIKAPEPILTDYSIRTLTNNSIPATINSRNNGDSPLYGGNDYSVRIPTITEWIERQLMQPVIWPK